MEFVSPEGLRIDGRRFNEVRRLSCQRGVLATADGSAIFEMGNTKAREAQMSIRRLHQHSRARPGSVYRAPRFHTLVL